MVDVPLPPAATAEGSFLLLSRIYDLLSQRCCLAHLLPATALRAHHIHTHAVPISLHTIAAVLLYPHRGTPTPPICAFRSSPSLVYIFFVWDHACVRCVRVTVPARPHGRRSRRTPVRCVCSPDRIDRPVTFVFQLLEFVDLNLSFSPTGRVAFQLPSD